VCLDVACRRRARVHALLLGDLAKRNNEPFLLPKQSFFPSCSSRCVQINETLLTTLEIELVVGIAQAASSFTRRATSGGILACHKEAASKICILVVTNGGVQSRWQSRRPWSPRSRRSCRSVLGLLILGGHAGGGADHVASLGHVSAASLEASTVR
jgi:hypothetical protein